MNKDDIKKAFDICFSAQKSCNGCPLLGLEKQNGRGCKYNLFTSVFDIITEQEEEIERLKAECEYRKKQYDTQLAENTRLHIEYDKVFERLKAQQREINALRAENEELEENLDMLIKEKKEDYAFEKKQAKIDVLNELKDKMFEREYMGVKYKERIFYESEIDEMIEELKK